MICPLCNSPTSGGHACSTVKATIPSDITRAVYNLAALGIDSRPARIRHALDTLAGNLRVAGALHEAYALGREGCCGVRPYWLPIAAADRGES